MEQAYLLGLTVIVALLLFLEQQRHAASLRRIPYRIHVNGTRGKSSVARLIAAGLRAGGLRVVAKTTGSASRVILEDGSEAPVVRSGRPTIAEQKRFLAWAADRNVDAVVAECMAVRPDYQRASEAFFLQANIAVITNVRPDHLEVLGPDLDAMVRAFSSVIPRQGVVVTAEQARLRIISDAAARRGSEVVVVSPTAELSVASEPFAENVAMAVEVCQRVGVDKATALRGMQHVRPDPGALNVFSVTVDSKSLTCVNAFAANDPVSARIIWNRLTGEHPRGAPVVLYNHRTDRPLRGRLFAEFLLEIAPAAIIVIGEAPRQMARRLIQRGLSSVQAMESKSPSDIMRVTAESAGEGGLILGLGNIGGVGMQLVRFWEELRRD